mgnify:CR=1 FL=1
MPEIVRGRKGTAGAQCPHLRSLQDSLSPPPYLGKEVKALPSQEIKALRTEVHKIGVNINQIARSVNAGIAKAEDARRGLYLLEQVYELMYEVAKK